MFSMSSGQYIKAESDYSQSLAIFSDDPLVFKSRADIRGKLAKPDEAIQDYKQALYLQSRIKHLGPNRTAERMRTDRIPAV